jgi:superfamily II DNA/RNA helicase
LKFTDFDLHPSILEGLEATRFTDATPIQEKCIPEILAGKDLLGTAQTGTGKTGAFVIPLLDKLVRSKEDGTHNGGTQILILSPTRELASQIDEQIFALGYHTGVTSAIVIGGSDFSSQAKSMKSGVDIIVATPGRLLDQLNVLQLKFDDLKYLVLDEADRMLDMGFLPDVKNIIRKVPKERQTLFFSATFPPQIQKLTDEIMKDPVRVNVATTKVAETIVQDVYKVYEAEKLNLIDFLFHNELDKVPAIIFSSTKKGTDQLYRALNKRGFSCEAMHGDRTQEEREAALRAFSTGKSSILIATDVIARGIDIQDVGVIINFDCPKSVEDYVHRIGRTGRNEKSGRAITFVSPRDIKLYKLIKDKVGKSLNELIIPDEVMIEEDKPKQKPSSNKPVYEDKKASTVASSESNTPKPKQRDNYSSTHKSARSLDGPDNSKTEPTSKKPVITPKRVVKPILNVKVERVQTATDSLKPGTKPVKGYWGLFRALFNI